MIGGLLEQQHYGAALAFLDDYALRQKDLDAAVIGCLRGDALQGLKPRYRQMKPTIAGMARLGKTDLAAVKYGWNGKGAQVAAASAAALEKRRNPISGESAVEIRPANAQFLNNLAFAMMHLGQGASSVFHFRQAHELDPGSSLIRNNLIIALNLGRRYRRRRPGRFRAEIKRCPRTRYRARICAPEDGRDRNPGGQQVMTK